VGICCGGEAVLLMSRRDPWPLEELLEMLGQEADLVLVEGKGRSSLPKVVVLGGGGEERYDPLQVPGVVAVVAEEGDFGPIPRFRRGEVEGLAERILEVLDLAR
jgi:molybdopterin-guanine dinucleotide biosynthesis protein